MSKHRHIDKICSVIMVFSLLLTILFMNGSSFGIVQAERAMGYEERLFDNSRVHTIDIVMEDWEEFIDNCTDEEYRDCSVVIDGEAYKNVGIRAKGNTSLSSVAAYGNDRYSFKIEFDKYTKGKSYYGLDKLSLNNIIQDNTYLKDYLSYTMMRDMGVASPLCSFVFITVNGEDWGLYLAVEGVEEGFLQRNYGTDYGELYKPDSLSFGGGRGNGMDFEMDDFRDQFFGTDHDQQIDWTATSADDRGQNRDTMPQGFDPNMMGAENSGRMPQNFDPSTMGKGNGQEMPQNFDPTTMDKGNGQEMPQNFDPNIMGSGNDGTMSPGDAQEMPQGFDPSLMGGEFNMGGMGSSDVKLQYIDDDPESYSNIFENAKTDVTDSDKERLIDSLKTLSEGEDIETVVDVEAVIKYFVVHNFVCNGDSYTGSMVHNYYLYEKDGVMSMIPWDYNLAFGGFGMGGGFGTSGATSEVNSPIDSPVSDGDISTRPMVAWIFENEEYTELYHQYYEYFISQYFESGYFTEMIDKVIDLISPYVAKDPTSFCTYEEFEKGVETIKTFCTLRAKSIRGQLEGTIPSTSEGQSEDSSSLVDASEITISDMGSMNGGGEQNGFGGFESFGGDRPDVLNNSESSDTPPAEVQDILESDESDSEEGLEEKETQVESTQEDNKPDQENETENDRSFRGEPVFGDGFMTENMTENRGVSQAEQWIWVGVSAAALLLGILFAAKLKRR